MKNLLERAGGVVETARRWVKWINERRQLQARIQRLEYDGSCYRVQIAKLRNDVEARDALVEDMRVARDHVPEDIKPLLETAQYVFERAAKGGNMPVADMLRWLSEWRASRYNRERRGRGYVHG